MKEQKVVVYEVKTYGFIDYYEAALYTPGLNNSEKINGKKLRKFLFRNPDEKKEAKILAEKFAKRSRHRRGIEQPKGGE
tara:strand:- start:18 stop:254 length:237 start_codon:yes stop_codon:yes gene_type:complete